MARLGHEEVRRRYRHDIEHEDEDHVTLWKAWFLDHGIDPSNVRFDQLIERRDYHDPRTGERQRQIVWLEDGMRDGEPILVHRERNLNGSPDHFPCVPGERGFDADHLHKARKTVAEKQGL